MEPSVKIKTESTVNTATIRWEPPVEGVCNLHGWEKKGTGVVSFGMLPPDTQWEVVVNIGNQGVRLQGETGEWNEVDYADDNGDTPDSRLYVSPKHSDLSWVRNIPSDILIGYEQEIFTSPSFVHRLFAEALFVLPMKSQLVILPNPMKRFSIDLSKEIDWSSSRRMHKNRLKKYRLSIDHDFKNSLRLVSEAHSAKVGSGKWITDKLIDLLSGFNKHNAQNEIQHHAFELWEGDAIVAVSVGFSYGRVYHDYTHATLDRGDSRTGTLLTKVVGDHLQKCGYALWYWGQVSEGTSYMADYIGKYGGGELSREGFYARWDVLKTESARPLHEPLDLGETLVAKK
eukprot:TRINITY_DN15668_c0_g2_i1.p1 TRINITY_DN15668_c0_g2~~TRINITY_DN15668_c0_g2_i1.p1  ORF type:complete len:353 (+),score=59.27 TRINITY_DN15668_c0_g2_i1:31-1059(+)